MQVTKSRYQLNRPQHVHDVSGRPAPTSSFPLGMKVFSRQRSWTPLFSPTLRRGLPLQCSSRLQHSRMARTRWEKARPQR